MFIGFGGWDIIHLVRLFGCLPLLLMKNNPCAHPGVLYIDLYIHMHANKCMGILLGGVCINCSMVQSV